MSLMLPVFAKGQALEESPEYFWEQFSPYAASYPVSPEPLGSPLLEVLTPLGPIYTFDRGLVPYTASLTQIILHGQVESWQESPQNNPLNHLGGGRYELCGAVSEMLGRGLFVLELAQSTESLEKVKVLLYSPHPPVVGQVITARLLPPLMAFRPETNR